MEGVLTEKGSLENRAEYSEDSMMLADRVKRKHVTTKVERAQGDRIAKKENVLPVSFSFILLLF